MYHPCHRVQYLYWKMWCYCKVTCGITPQDAFSAHYVLTVSCDAECCLHYMHDCPQNFLWILGKQFCSCRIELDLSSLRNKNKKSVPVCAGTAHTVKCKIVEMASAYRIIAPVITAESPHPIQRHGPKPLSRGCRVNSCDSKVMVPKHAGRLRWYTVCNVPTSLCTTRPNLHVNQVPTSLRSSTSYKPQHSAVITPCGHLIKTDSRTWIWGLRASVLCTLWWHLETVLMKLTRKLAHYHRTLQDGGKGNMGTCTLPHPYRHAPEWCKKQQMYVKHEFLRDKSNLWTGDLCWPCPHSKIQQSSRRGCAISCYGDPVSLLWQLVDPLTVSEGGTRFPLGSLVLMPLYRTVPDSSRNGMSVLDEKTLREGKHAHDIALLWSCR